MTHGRPSIRDSPINDGYLRWSPLDRCIYEFLWTTTDQDLFSSASIENFLVRIRVPVVRYRFELEEPRIQRGLFQSTTSSEVRLRICIGIWTQICATFFDGYHELVPFWTLDLQALPPIRRHKSCWLVIMARSEFGIKFEFICLLVYCSASRFYHSSQSTYGTILMIQRVGIHNR